LQTKQIMKAQNLYNLLHVVQDFKK